MATRSLIGMKKPDNTVEYIYCHWDGYPSHHLPILKNHYSDRDNVEDLISFGALSVLSEKISAPEGDYHTFEDPINNVCVFYNRDRGEDWEQNKPRIVSLEEYNNPSFGFDLWIDYKYLFNDGVWECQGVIDPETTDEVFTTVSFRL